MILFFTFSNFVSFKRIDKNFSKSFFKLIGTKPSKMGIDLHLTLFLLISTKESTEK
jgi:hypothetical protein